jgi:protein TonB
MQNGGFTTRPKTNPFALGIIIAGHAALLTAIALNPTRFGPRIDFIPRLTDYHDPAPPPPEQPPPKHREKPDAARLKPVVPLFDRGPLIAGPIHLQPLSTDPGPIAPPQPIAEPVIRQAVPDPAVADRFQPDYPPAKVRSGEEGLATVRALIGSDGRVKAVELVTASDPAFFEATRAQALRWWRFRPATRDGVAIESWRTMTVRFRLQG